MTHLVDLDLVRKRYGPRYRAGPDGHLPSRRRRSNRRAACPEPISSAHLLAGKARLVLRTHDEGRGVRSDLDP